MNVKSGIATKHTPSIAALLTILIVAVMVIWTPHASIAQTDQGTAVESATPLTCDQLIPAVKNNLSKGCNTLARDQICYGNPAISVQRQDNTADATTFNQPGNAASAQGIKVITTAPLDLSRGEW